MRGHAVLQKCQVGLANDNYKSEATLNYELFLHSSVSSHVDKHRCNAGVYAATEGITIRYKFKLYLQSNTLIIMATMLIVVILTGLIFLLMRRRRARSKAHLHKERIYMQSLAASPVE